MLIFFRECSVSSLVHCGRFPSKITVLGIRETGLLVIIKVGSKLTRVTKGMTKYLGERTMRTTRDLFGSDR